MRTQIVVILILGLLTLSQTTQAEGLERLFTTAQERQKLNDIRTNPPPPPGTEEPTAPPHITFNGLVTRSDGPTTVWVNGSEELHRSGFNIDIDKREDISVPITLTKARQELWLKPGQTVSTLDGKIVENQSSNSKSIESEH
jgi:hypothetical protein